MTIDYGREENFAGDIVGAKIVEMGADCGQGENSGVVMGESRLWDFSLVYHFTASISFWLGVIWFGFNQESLRSNIRPLHETKVILEVRLIKCGKIQ